MQASLSQRLLLLAWMPVVVAGAWSLCADPCVIVYRYPSSLVLRCRWYLKLDNSVFQELPRAFGLLAVFLSTLGYQ